MSDIEKHADSKPLQFQKDESGESMLNRSDALSDMLESFGLSPQSDDSVSTEIFKGNINSLIRNGSSEEEVTRQVNMILAQLHSIKPKDTIEAMLALQIIGVHQASLRAMSGAERNNESGYLESHKVYVNSISKLCSSSSKLVNALSNYRKKGKQEMTVKHVHVHKGGKAAIGNFNGKGEGE